MYQALYRKWRPRAFTDLVGQEHVTETLRRQVASGRLSHAYLFVGTRGTGKTSCAKILARAVNCEHPKDGDPCNECPSCIGIEDGSILDVLELDAASNNGVDNVRALREEAVYTPATVRRRVYIIDEVHMLSPAAFNALLKIMEEPPEHLLFILATTELHKVPATILSRCQRFSFKRLAPDVIAGRLRHVAGGEGITLTDDAAVRLARLGDGSMRDALSLLDQCASGETVDLDRVLTMLGLASGDETVRLVSSVLSRNAAAALAVLDTLYADGKDMLSALSDMAGLLRDTLLRQLARGGGDRLLSGVYSDKTLDELAEGAAPERLFFCLDTIKDSLASLSRGASARLAAELCVLRLCDERLSSGEAALLSRLSQLEQGYNAPEAPRPVPESAPAPEQKPKPVPESAPVLDQNEEPDDTSGVPVDFWARILALLKSEIQVYALLSDANQVAASISGGKLVIRAGNPFMVQTIESKAFSEPIRRAAETVLGRTVTVAVTRDDNRPPAKPSALQTSALVTSAPQNSPSEFTEKSIEAKPEPSAIDRLGAFDIVKFE